ncbi:MAG: nuclear transport factor 2 family protein [Arenimonas sp.]
MSHANAELLEKFYNAFANLDAETMASCYHENAEFEDPAFSLHGKKEVVGMWTMLCTTVKEKGRDVWQFEYSDIAADDLLGKAHWEPRYRFSATGRMVHNIVDAKFGFKDGLIISHQDHFDFWRWSKQALGTPGVILGWSSFLKKKVRSQAAANLAAFMAKR